MVWAWMLWESNALEHWTLFWLKHGCSLNRKLSTMDVIMVEAGMLWESNSVDNGRLDGLDMHVVGIECCRKWT